MTQLVFLGAPALVIGLVLSLFFATSAVRALLLTALGVTTVLGLVTLGYLSASRSSEACHDCAAYRGRWLDPLLFIWATFNVGAWFVGVFVGSLFRREDRLGERRVYEIAPWLVAGAAAIAFWILAESGYA